jgi:hypothetical protein
LTLLAKFDGWAAHQESSSGNTGRHC